MKADIHTHLWPADRTIPSLVKSFAAIGAETEYVMSPEGLLESLGDIDMAVIATLSPGGRASNTELESYHEYTAEQVKKYPDRFMAFCSADPHDPEGSLPYIEDYIERRGFVGLKLHPNVQEFYANDPGMFPIYERMQEYGLPVMFHTGGIGVMPFCDKFGRCEYLDEVACRFPDMAIIMGHAGRGNYTETASILRKHPNVYADISANSARMPGQEHGILAELVKTVKLWSGSVDKLLFGSDYPYYFPNKTVELLKRLGTSAPESISEEDVYKILEVNAGKFIEKHVLPNKRIDTTGSYC